MIPGMSAGSWPRRISCGDTRMLRFEATYVPMSAPLTLHRVLARNARDRGVRALGANAPGNLHRRLPHSKISPREA